MFDTAHYLHYVLDTAPEAHYTEDMMKLSSEAFLWHELKECNGFDGVAFLTSENQKLRLKVYDAESAQIFKQEKKGLFSGQKEVAPRIQPESFFLSELKRPDKEMLRWLIDRQKKAKNKKTALVSTVDALESLYRHADEKDQAVLVEEGKKSSQDILLVRLPQFAEQLQRALDSMGVLAKLDPAVAQLPHSKARRPMLSILEEQLPGRFTDLGDSPAQMENMLLRDELTQGDGEDSPEQLSQQAQYLYLCCRYRVKTELIPNQPMTPNLVAQSLRSSGFRERLRHEVDRLLRSEEGASITSLFHKAYKEQLESGAELRVCYADDLVSRVAALPKLEDCDIVWSLKKVPQSLCTALRTLWNLPRNQRVCDMIETCCGAIHSAYPEQDWATVTDALLLLQLCTRYLCTPPRMEENLKDLFQSAEEVLSLSAECFRLSKDQQQFHQIHQSMAKDALSRLQDKIYDGTKTLEQNIYYLKVKRADLHDKIVFFNARERDPQEISEFLSKKLQQLETKKLQQQKVQAAIGQAVPVWEEEPPAPKGAVDWSHLVGARPWETEEPAEDTLTQIEEDPFDFG